MALTLWVALRHEEEHRQDLSVEVGIIALGLLAISASLSGLIRNLRDAHREQRLRAQVVSIKDENALLAKSLRDQLQNREETVIACQKKYEELATQWHNSNRNTPLFKSISARWGNEHSTSEVGDIIERMPRNAVAFHISPDAFKPYDPLRADPAPGDDNKFLELTYSYAGWPRTTLRKKQGEWIVLPADPSLGELQRQIASIALPIIVVTWGELETPWRNGFRLLYSGGDDPLLRVTIAPLSKLGRTATFNVLPYLEKGKVGYIVPEVQIDNQPQVRGEFTDLFEWDQFEVTLDFKVIGFNHSVPFVLGYRAEANPVNPEIIEVIPGAG